MGQHAQRFSSGKAQKGTALHGVAQALADIADTVEESYDPNSPEVVRAMQYFEQGLGALSTAPDRPEQPEEAPKRRRATPKGEKQDGEGDDA